MSLLEWLSSRSFVSRLALAVGFPLLIALALVLVVSSRNQRDEEASAASATSATPNSGPVVDIILPAPTEIPVAAGVSADAAVPAPALEAVVTSSSSPSNAIPSVAAASAAAPPPASAPTASGAPAAPSAPAPAAPPAAAPVAPSPTPVPNVTAATSPSVSTARITSFTDVVTRGATASLSALVAPNSQCSLAMTMPSGRPSLAQGLGAKAADASGNVTWTWQIAQNVTPGNGTVRLQCNARGGNGTTSSSASSSSLSRTIKID